MKNAKASFLGNIKRNWKSGVTVSLVSIPLSISLAVAANSKLIMGITRAFWAGLIASILGGSNYNIVGPTEALKTLGFEIDKRNKEEEGLDLQTI